MRWGNQAASATTLLIWFLVAPASMSQARTPLVYVASISGDTVTVIDATTDQSIGTIPVGDGPDGIAASPDSRRVYIANAFTNDVSVIDTASNQVIATVPVGQNPIGLAVTPNGDRVYVANFATPGSVSVIDTIANSSIATIATADGPDGVVVSANGAKVYIGIATGAGFVTVIDTATNSISGTIGVGANPRGMAISADGAFVYVANSRSDNVSVISTATDSVVATIPAGQNPIDLAATPDGLRLFVANISFDTVPGAGSMSIIDAIANAPLLTLATGNHPDGVVVTPDGRKVFFGTTGCCGGPETVSILDVVTSTVVSSVPVGANAGALAVAAVRCPPMPRAGCRGAARSSLKIRDQVDDSKDRLLWKYAKGDSTLPAEFGDPAVSSYSLCLYGGTTNAQIAGGQIEVAADSAKWSSRADGGFGYADAAGASDGAFRALLKPSDRDRTRLLLDARGTNLPEASLPLPTPLTVQLIQSDSAVCWQTTFDADSVRRNEAACFKASTR